MSKKARVQIVCTLEFDLDLEVYAVDHPFASDEQRQRFLRTAVNESDDVHEWFESIKEDRGLTTVLGDGEMSLEATGHVEVMIDDVTYVARRS